LKLRNLSPNYSGKVWVSLSKFKDHLNRKQPTPVLTSNFLSYAQGWDDPIPEIIKEAELG